MDVLGKKFQYILYLFGAGKKFELLRNEWSIDTGEMTPKMSLKRKVIMEKYKDAVERIYD